MLDNAVRSACLNNAALIVCYKGADNGRSLFGQETLWGLFLWQWHVYRCTFSLSGSENFGNETLPFHLSFPHRSLLFPVLSSLTSTLPDQKPSVSFLFNDPFAPLPSSFPYPMKRVISGGIMSLSHGCGRRQR